MQYHYTVETMDVKQVISLCIVSIAFDTTEMRRIKQALTENKI